MEDDKFDKEKWFESNSARYGIPIEPLRKVFKNEFESETNIDAPLEVPDIIKVYYKYSYGQQSRFFRELRDNKRIMGAKCPKCGIVYCPPRANCSRCYISTEWIEMSGQGTIVTYTITYYSPPTGFDRKVPFVIAYVKLDGSDFIILAVVEMEDVNLARVGMRVEVVFRKEREGRITDFFFKPIGPK